MYLILGKSGYIAQSFVEVCEQRKVPYFAVSRSLVDYTNPIEFRDYLQAFRNVTGKTAFVINCAGFIGKPNVDACEDNKEDTILGNVVFPAAAAAACRINGFTYVHISSGCIYNGYDKDFRETDVPNFTFANGSFYSGSKALAEQVAIQNYPHSYVFRLRVPFDEKSSPRNYITKMMSYDKLLDVRNSFSHRADFVNGCLDLIERNAPSGIYNLTNPGSLTTREVVDMIKTHTGVDKNFSFYSDEDTFLQDVKAPRSSCVLDVSKALRYINLRDVRCAFTDALENYDG
tara:strand:+ start:14423 stop:15286 length:864 start_codon:yes stop_codon:yes gene_type:complete